MWVRSPIPVGRGARLQRRDAGGWRCSRRALSEIPTPSIGVAVLAAAIDARRPRRQRRRLALRRASSRRPRERWCPCRWPSTRSVVLWIPEMSTSTGDRGRRSRRRCRSVTPRSTSAARRCSSLRWRPATSRPCARLPRTGCTRTCASPRPSRSRLALAAGLEAGAWAAGCRAADRRSRSMCAPTDAERLAATLPDRGQDGRAVVTTIDHTGATVEDRPVAPRRDSDEWSYNAHCSSRRPRRHCDERCAPPRHSSLIAEIRRIGGGGGGQAAGEHEGLVGEEAWHGAAWCGRVRR